MTALARPPQDLDPDSFRAIAELAYRECGLTLVEAKSSMICSRLRHRLRALQVPDFAAYSRLLQSDHGRAERRHLISALTTNVSHFFREQHHFCALRGMVQTRAEALRRGEEMRLWSAGCANGQEAFSAAMTIQDVCTGAEAGQVRILGTDIDPKVVRFARAATYHRRQLGGVPPGMLRRFFSAGNSGDAPESFTATEDLRRMVRFNELNLLGPWPMTRRFDVIFCRNVVIYFDLATQQRLWPRFHDALGPEGLLFLGHSERIAEPERFGFRCVGPTIYRALPAPGIGKLAS